MSNTLINILVVYVIIGILYSAISCIRYREVMSRSDYFKIVPWTLLWPVSLLMEIAFAVLFRIVVKPHQHDFLYNFISIFAFCEWLKSLRR